MLSKSTSIFALAAYKVAPLAVALWFFGTWLMDLRLF